MLFPHSPKCAGRVCLLVGSGNRCSQVRSGGSLVVPISVATGPTKLLPVSSCCSRAVGIHRCVVCFHPPLPPPASGQTCRDIAANPRPACSSTFLNQHIDLIKPILINNTKLLQAGSFSSTLDNSTSRSSSRCWAGARAGAAMQNITRRRTLLLSLLVVSSSLVAGNQARWAHIGTAC